MSPVVVAEANTTVFGCLAGASLRGLNQHTARMFADSWACGFVKPPLSYCVDLQAGRGGGILASREFGRKLVWERLIVVDNTLRKNLHVYWISCRHTGGPDTTQQTLNRPPGFHLTGPLLRERTIKGDMLMGKDGTFCEFETNHGIQ
jgi:hypothetical protein